MDGGAFLRIIMSTSCASNVLDDFDFVPVASSAPSSFHFHDDAERRRYFARKQSNGQKYKKRPWGVVVEPADAETLL